MEKAKLGLVIFLCILAFMEGGTSSVIKNNTSEQVLQNISEIYTLTMSVDLKGEHFVPHSCTARIIIEGEVHRMNKNSELDYV